MLLLGLSVLGSLFYIGKKKVPGYVSGFRITKEVLPTATSKGSITFYWTPSKNANYYTLNYYFLDTWITTITNVHIEYLNNTAVFSYDSVTTNQENGRPNVIFNIRANNDLVYYAEQKKTMIRHELKNSDTLIII
jgi:hypothetical protein